MDNNNISYSVTDTFKEDELNLIKNNSELFINDLSKANDVIENKANVLLGFLILVMTSITGYVVSEYKNFDIYKLIAQEIIITSSFVSVSIYYVYKCISLNNYKLLGTRPSFHIKHNYKENHNKLKVIYQDILHTNESIIDYNFKVHNKKVLHFKKSLNWLLFAIIISFCYALLYILATSLYNC